MLADGDVADGEHKRTVGLLEDLVKVRLHLVRLLQLEIRVQMAAHFLEIGAKEADETDAQLNQLHRTVEHKVPRKGAAKGRHSNVPVQSTTATDDATADDAADARRISLLLLIKHGVAFLHFHFISIFIHLTTAAAAAAVDVVIETDE